eukprot:5181083-Pleurochrysis_carterae.AAC.1
MQPRARPRPRRRLACARWPPLLRAMARDAARETIVPKLPYSFCALINFSVEPVPYHTIPYSRNEACLVVWLASFARAGDQ